MDNKSNLVIDNSSLNGYKIKMVEELKLINNLIDYVYQDVDKFKKDLRILEEDVFKEEMDKNEKLEEDITQIKQTLDEQKNTFTQKIETLTKENKQIIEEAQALSEQITRIFPYSSTSRSLTITDVNRNDFIRQIRIFQTNVNNLYKQKNVKKGGKTRKKSVKRKKTIRRRSSSRK